MIKAILMLIGSFVLFFIPREISLLLARKIGFFLKIFMKEKEKIARKNLFHLGANKKGDIKELFSNLAIVSLDILQFPYLTRKKVSALVKTKGEEILREYLKKGSVIFVTPHLGNWELGGAYLGLNKYPIYAVAESIKPKKSIFPELISIIFKKYRESTGINQIPIEKPGKILKAIKGNNLLVLLGDRDISKTGKEFDFLYSKWRVPLGPATLSLKKKIPIFTGYIVIKKNRYYGLVEGPLPFEDLKYDENGVEELTRRIIKNLEKYIKTYPTQWLVFEELKTSN